MAGKPSLHKSNKRTSTTTVDYIHIQLNKRDLTLLCDGTPEIVMGENAKARLTVAHLPHIQIADCGFGIAD